MNCNKWSHLVLFLGMSLLVLTPCHFVSASSLTLQKAERAALSQSPEIKSIKAIQNALKESSLAAGQLMDPMLMLGAMNLPADTYDLRQEPMTQLKIGIQQSLPRGQSLKYRSLHQWRLSNAHMQKNRMTRLQILRGLRHSWLSLHLWLKSEEIILKQKIIFQHLVNVTESMLANNKAQQKDVIRSQLELNELNNRLFHITQQVESARAELGRWIGMKLARQAHPVKIPRWKNPPSLGQMHQLLVKHPMLLMDREEIYAAKSKVNLAKQLYKPRFSLSAEYGFRQGRNMNRSHRADFVSGQVNLDLPLFAKNRQDHLFNASQLWLVASQESRDIDSRELNKVLIIQYTIWRQQQNSSRFYSAKLIPEAKQYAEAAMSAYQNNQTDFPTLARAYVRELNTELAGFKASVNLKMARINLLYLQGK
jgi:outer membrane protein TolC